MKAEKAPTEADAPSIFPIVCGSYLQTTAISASASSRVT